MGHFHTTSTKSVGATIEELLSQLPCNQEPVSRSITSFMHKVTCTTDLLWGIAPWKILLYLHHGWPLVKALFRISHSENDTTSNEILTMYTFLASVSTSSAPCHMEPLAQLQTMQPALWMDSNGWTHGSFESVQPHLIWNHWPGCWQYHQAYEADSNG